MSEARRTAPVKVACAGAGMISWYHLTGWKKLGARVQLVAICDPDAGNAQRRADEFGIARVYADRDRMLAEEKIDALDVASPRETHADWVEAAAARGIDVLCQKPLTPTLAEAEALVRRVAGRCRLMVHENWRFRPWYRELRRWIEAGDLGEIILARMAMISSGFLPDETGRRPAFVRQPFMQHERRLMLAEVLIHHIDVMRYLCGELRVAAARAARTLPDVAGETFAAVLFENAAGTPVEVVGTMAAAGYPPRTPDRVEIIGTKASAIFDGNILQLAAAVRRKITYDGDQGYQASFDGVIAHFVDCLEQGKPFETDPADNLQTLRLVEHAYWAAGLHGLEGREAAS
ncbi:MAG TPA: Gfo/Idh/MocA family oxidoreductase [Stellaceae bacterium]|nr:Gfo/Idh/MocA family oxidoreductase [Stellaceae bacterium]